MKAGLTTSVVMHAALLGFGLFTLSAPSALEVADIEALPVDIVPVEEITQIQQGDKTATVNETPAPLPTKKPDIVPEAQKVGENTVDTDKPVTPDAKPKPVETAAVKLPKNPPAPEARPNPPQAQTAKTPDRKQADKPTQEAAAKPKSTEKEFNADEVAALLNKEKASGGGAKRSTQQAALGGEKTTSGSKLSQSEMDALRGQIQRCWNVPAGALDGEALKVSVHFRLDPSGALEGAPEIIAGGGSSGVERAAAEAARRAVSRCAPYNLPADKYDAWADVIVNFDP